MALTLANAYFYAEGNPANSPYSRIQTNLGASTETIKGCLSMMGVGGKEVIPGSNLYYMENTASDLTPGHRLVTGTLSKEQQYSCFVLDTDSLPKVCLIKKFYTDSGDPGVSSIMSGSWPSYLLCKYVDNEFNTLTKKIYVKVYQRTNIGAENLIFTSTPQSISTSKTFQITAGTASGSWNSGSRLLVEVYIVFDELGGGG